MSDTVRTFNLSGKFISEFNFSTPEKAHEEYKDIIDNAKRTLPTGFGINVVRFSNDKIMSMETVIGTH